MNKQSKHFYEFGPFRLDATERLLFREGAPVPLKLKVFDTLLALVENSGHILEKDNLLQTVWPDTIVEENNLTQTISMLRKVLGEGQGEQKYIETIPRRGYRFIAAVKETWDSADCGLRIADCGLPVEGQVGIEEETAQPAPVVAAPPDAHVRRRLEWHVWAGLALLVGLAGAYFWVSRRSEPGETIRAIAILPLDNLSGDPTQEYFADGMTDTMITNLAQIDALRVISRTSVMQYKGARKPLPEIAKALRVDAVVEGAVSRSGDRVRISVQLIHAATDRHLWAKTYERDLRDVLVLQNEVARAIAQEIRIKLTPQEQTRMASARPVQREAYDAYLKGRYFWNTPLEDKEKSIDYFKQAIEKDPNYALAYAGLVDAYIRLEAIGKVPPREIRTKARAAAMKAVELDDTLAETHTALGQIKLHHELDWSGAEREFQRASALNPRYMHAHASYGYLLVAGGRREEAIAELKRVQDLDPLSLVVNTHLSGILYYAGHYDEALAQARQVVEMDPNFWFGHQRLGQSYEQKGMYEEAIAEFQKAINLSGGPRDLAMLSHAYALSGKRAEAEKLLDELKELYQQQYASPYFIAQIYAALGEKDQAFAWLHKACVERARGVINLKVEPQLQALHSDPRFADLVRCIGLAP